MNGQVKEEEETAFKNSFHIFNFWGKLLFHILLKKKKVLKTLKREKWKIFFWKGRLGTYVGR